MENTPRNINDLINAGKVVKPQVKLTMEDKERMAADGTVLTFVSVQMADDPKTGPYWDIMAEVDGDPVGFSMSMNKRRDAFLASLAAATVDGPITGLRFVPYPGVGDNHFIQVEPA